MSHGDRLRSAKAEVPDLTDTDRAVQLRAARAKLHGTKLWRRSLRELQSLCLVTGYVRPSGGAAGTWGDQVQVAPLGTDESPEVAEIESICDQIAEAMEFQHPCYKLL